MKISVGNRRVPTDHDVLADAQFELAQKQGISEVAIVSDLDTSPGFEREVNPAHGTVRAEDQRAGHAAPKASETSLHLDHRSGTWNDVGRQLAGNPAAGRDGFNGRAHPPRP